MAVPDVPYGAILLSVHEAQIYRLRDETASLRRAVKLLILVVGALALLGAALAFKIAGFSAH